MRDGYICRVYLVSNSARIWVLYDYKYTMRGKPGETMSQVAKRFAVKHGRRKWTKFKGVMRDSEFAMTVSRYRLTLERLDGVAETPADWPSE